MFNRKRKKSADISETLRSMSDQHIMMVKLRYELEKLVFVLKKENESREFADMIMRSK